MQVEITKVTDAVLSYMLAFTMTNAFQGNLICQQHLDTALITNVEINLFSKF